MNTAKLGDAVATLATSNAAANSGQASR